MSFMDRPRQSPDPVDTGGIKENKEALNLPPVYVVYRDNTLYSTLVPKIAAEMQKVGRKVFVQAFPQGTPKEEIKKYFQDEETKKALKDVELLSDSTSGLQVEGDLNASLKKKYSLDNLSGKIMGNSLVGKEVFEKKDKEIRYEDEFNATRNVVKALAAEHPELTDELFIVTHHIGDHNFNFNRIGMTAGIKESDTPEEITEKITNNEKFKEIVNLGFEKDKLVELFMLDRSVGVEKDDNKRQDLYREFLRIWGEFVGNKIKDSLKDIIPEEKIHLIPLSFFISSAMTKMGRKGEKAKFVIQDRHTDPPEDTKLADKNITIGFPFDSMMNDIIQKGYLKVDFDIDKSVEEQVNKVFKNS